MNRLLAYLLLFLLLATGGSPASGQLLKVGVMLPLHDENGDGRRMVEYYRGLLMGCDSLRRTGISIGVHAWNLAENGSVSDVLKDPAAAECDIIFGPLYTKQVKVLADFAKAHQQKLVIPFSTRSTEVNSNSHVFQVYQNTATLTEAVVSRFVERYKGCHAVIIDCNDTTSTLGVYTKALRQRMEKVRMDYNVTNLNSPADNFAKSFVADKRNIVVLNSSREAVLGKAFQKLNVLKGQKPETKVELFGYADWLSYTKNHLDNYYKYNVTIPSPYYYNAQSSATLRFQQKYRWNFHQDMMPSVPHFALTGFDHALFFLRGLYIYGKNFTGGKGTVRYEAVQTPLEFTRLPGGGMQNHSLLLVHYRPERRVETMKY